MTRDLKADVHRRDHERVVNDVRGGQRKIFSRLDPRLPEGRGAGQYSTIGPPVGA